MSNNKKSSSLTESSSAEDWMTKPENIADIGQGWKSRLIVTEKNIPKRLLANAIIAFTYAPEWLGVLGFNKFSLDIVILKNTPWKAEPGTKWTDQQDRLAANWLQTNGVEVGLEVAGQAIQTVAHERSFHPVQQYLESLEWDGVHRVNQWLNAYMGVKHDPYTSAVGERWLISAVARIMNPGCQVDHCLVLEGEQGMLKSSALRALAVRDEWFTDQISQLGTKDAALETMGVWIIEMGELSAMRKAEVEHVKGFLSRRVERFRPPYGKRPIEAPRQCVFAATTNDSEYLNDPTGARRFWPVKVGQIQVADVTRDKDQLWAEAFHLYRNGVHWWFDTAELTQLAQTEQSDRYQSESWEEPISQWIKNPTQRYENSQPISPWFDSDQESFTVSDILIHALGKTPVKQAPGDAKRVGNILRHLGYRPYDRPAGQPRPPRRWRYRPHTTTES
jgi:predicted P-loop ATPase